MRVIKRVYKTRTKYLGLMCFEAWCDHFVTLCEIGGALYV